MNASQIQTGAKPDGVVSDILFGVKQENTQEDQEIAQMVNKLFQKSRSWRENWAKDWVRFWNYWESNHYKGRVSHTLTQAVVNQVWSSVETFLGHVSDALPSPIARARNPQYKDKARLISKWLKYVMDINNVEQEIQHCVRSACVVGAGWMSVEWDETYGDNRGDVRLSPIDERFIFPAPYARNLDECLYLIEAKNVPREYVVKTWERGKDVPPGTVDGTLTNLRSYNDEKRHNSAAPNYTQVTTTTGSDSRWTGSSGVNRGNSQDLVILIKCYIRQDDGHMRLVVTANGVVMQDGLSPYDDDDFPYAVVNVIPTMDTIQGRGIVQFIEGLQEILNASISYLLDQQRFASDPMLIVDAENLEDGQLIDNTPGSVLPNSSQRGLGYYWMQAPGFNAAWVQVQEICSSYMDSVLGRVDVLKGERPAGVNTLGGLEIVRDEANIRIRTLIRWVKASLKRINLLTLSRLRQFARQERILRIVGKSGLEEFVTVNSVQGVAPDGTLIHDDTIPEDAEFDIEFGADIPGGRQAEVELAITLATTPAQDGLPMVDRQYVLEKAIMDEAPEVMDRMNEAAAQQQQDQAAQQQQQQQQMGANGQPQQPQQNPMDKIMAMFSGA